MALTQEGINKFVAAWYLALDQHAPIEECYKLLADKGLRVIFPDGDITDQPARDKQKIVIHHIASGKLKRFNQIERWLLAEHAG